MQRYPNVKLDPHSQQDDLDALDFYPDLQGFVDTMTTAVKVQYIYKKDMDKEEWWHLLNMTDEQLEEFYDARKVEYNDSNAIDGPFYVVHPKGPIQTTYSGHNATKKGEVTLHGKGTLRAIVPPKSIQPHYVSIVLETDTGFYPSCVFTSHGVDEIAQLVADQLNQHLSYVHGAARVDNYEVKKVLREVNII